MRSTVVAILVLIISGARAPAADPKQNAAPRPPATAALNLVAPEFAAAIIVHPSRLAKSPLLAELPQDKLLASFTQFAGIDPRQVEQMVLLIEPFPGGNVAFLPAAILRFAGKVDSKQLLGKMLKDTEEADFEGKKYLQSKIQMARVPVCGYVIDDSTLAIAPEPTLKLMLVASKVARPLADRLAKTKVDKDLVVVAVAPPLRKKLAQLKQQAGEDANLAQIMAFAEGLEAATLTLDLVGDHLLRVSMDAKDAAAAGMLYDQIKQGLDQGRKAYAAQRKDLQGGLPPMLSAAAIQVLDQFVDAGTLSKNGTQIQFEAKRPKGMDELFKKLKDSLAQ
jgi:hypothetical protein